MTSRSRVYGILGLFGLAVILAGVVGVWQYSSGRGVRGTVVSNELGDARENLIYKSLEEEIEAFHRRLETLTSDPNFRKAKEADLVDLSRELEEMRRQADRLEFRRGREERLLDLAAQMSSQSSNTSFGMVSFISALFVIVVFGVGLGTSLQFKDLKEEFAGLQEQMKKFREDAQGQVNSVAAKVQESRTHIEVELSRLNVLTAAVGEQVQAGGVFLDGLINIHAEAFSEILSTLPLGRVFSDDEGKRVRLKGQELQGRLLLLHPSKERRIKAVMLLGAVGTKIAKSDLRRLQKASETDVAMALLIESAIRKIDEHEANRGL